MIAEQIPLFLFQSCSNFPTDKQKTNNTGNLGLQIEGLFIGMCTDLKKCNPRSNHDLCGKGEKDA